MKNLLFTLYLLIAPLSLQASFSISGSVITQSGTNSSLDGIQNLNGVSVSTQNNIRVYNIGNRRLVINGNLTIDPETEMLIVGYASGEMLVVQNNGRLTIGKQITTNGFTRYSEGMAIYLENCPSGFTDRVSFRNNARLDWYGGVISQYAGKFGFYQNSVRVRIFSENAKLIYRSVDPQNQIRQETNDFIANAFTFINGDLTVVAPNGQLNGYNPIHCSGAISFSGATPNQDVIFNGYRGGGSGNFKDIKFWQGSRPVFYNTSTGSNLKAGFHLSGGSSYGIAMVYQKLQVKTSNQDGSTIEGAKCFIRDHNNGNRQTYNKEGHIVNNTADKTYTLLTDNSGESSVEDILLGAVVVNTGTGDGVNTGVYSWDYRGKQNNSTDLFDLNFWNYDHLYLQVPNVQLKGVENKIVQAALIKDPFISKNKNAASAITGISLVHNSSNDEGTITISDSISLCDLYDFIKLDKVNNNLEEPEIGSLMVSVSENTLNIGDYTLILQNGAKLNPCDKYQKIVSNKVSTIANVSNNLKTALTDPNGNYKLIRMIGLLNADFEIQENGGGNTLASGTNASGAVNITVQTNTDSLSLLVTKTNFTNWNADIDITTADVFNFYITQSSLENSLGTNATLEKQENELFLLKKIFTKNTALANRFSGVDSTTVTINSVSQNGIINATLEKQEELINLLKQVLRETSKIETQLEE
ncbi:MAG: hypothetical protein N4A45_00655 [Flavobacteriales bacterium]|jgi:hypothetical protein|nr:hypothetical protein [Flavobacteriales bacterium]